MFPFTRDAVVWLRKSDRTAGSYTYDQIKALPANSPLRNELWWWNHRGQDRHNPPIGTFFTTEQVLDGHYIGNPSDRDNENYPSALARQYEMQEAERSSPHTAGQRGHQNDLPLDQAGPGRARRINANSHDRIWQRIDGSVARKGLRYTAYSIANTFNGPHSRGITWTMDGDDSNTALTTKDIGDSVFNDTKPRDLFYAIEHPGPLANEQSRIAYQQERDEQSRRDKALDTARNRAQQSGHNSPCTQYQGWGGLPANSIGKDANIWRRAGEPDVQSISATEIARDYVDDPSVGYELWHMGSAPSRCHSAQA